NESAASPVDTSQRVNTLNQLYPSTQVSLYPAPSASQAANTPQPVRFTNVDRILVRADSTDLIPEAIDQITEVLHERHRVAPGQPDDFNIRDMTESTRAMRKTATLTSILILGVALITLIVGGVGIMTVMLVAVTERTREIGLRMAVGARARAILLQFLAEAVMLCVAGGILGMLLGWGGSYFIAWRLLHWPIEASGWTVVVAL